jgi:hypothetical protein
MQRRGIEMESGTRSKRFLIFGGVEHVARDIAGKFRSSTRRHAGSHGELQASVYKA